MEEDKRPTHSAHEGLLYDSAADDEYRRRQGYGAEILGNLQNRKTHFVINLGGNEHASFSHKEKERIFELWQ